MGNLQVTEQPFNGDPQPGDPYPQSLQITFETDETEVQVATLWEGLIHFIPDSTAGYPQNPQDVTEANFSTWPLVGDLLLITADFSLREPFATHIPLIKQPPSLVRYSKVRLTRDFLFTTLRQVRLPIRLVENRAIVKLEGTDPLWHPKYVMAFLQGRAGVFCPIDPDDPAADFTNHPMPSVVVATGNTTTLTVTVSSRAEEVLVQSWFDREGDYDDIAGDSLVDPNIDNFQDQVRNPAHPGHSVIPLGAIFITAADEVFESSHRLSSLRNTVINQLTSGKPYRSIKIERPPTPGKLVSTFPQRSFPQYRINWKRIGTATIDSLRLPLSGYNYIPLQDGQYTFWAIPRSQDPTVVQTGDQLQLSLKQDTRKYIDLPSQGGEVTLDLVPGQTETKIYAHLHEYDSKRAWAEFQKAYDDKSYISLREAAKARLNPTGKAKLNWFINQFRNMEDYSPIYGHIAASAGRHGLAPEFLQAVLMGESVNDKIWSMHDYGLPYSEDALIHSIDHSGLDLIVYRLGLNDDPPPLPDEEFRFNLIDEGYLDTSFSDSLENFGKQWRDEGGVAIELEVADIRGWEAAVELVAAELHARLDEMLVYADEQNIAITTEEKKRYLAYIRFNASFTNARTYVDQLRPPSDHLENDRLKGWEGPPPKKENARYNALQRVAAAEWFEAVGVYR
jgi:hypothetical protein